jgi:hypothetical protein
MAADRQAARKEILAAVREMAREFPDSDYCFARSQFGLLGKISVICDRNWPTAKQCWESVGLDRSHLVDEFEFTQSDLRNKAA